MHNVSKKRGVEMNVLEKILEEIDKIKGVIKAPIYENCFGDECGDNGDCMVCVCEKIMDIIRSHMDDVENDGWIPVSEGLPEVPEGTEDDDCPEFNATIKGADKATTLKYAPDGTWFDDSGEVYKVVAWKSLPEPYKGE